MVRGAHDGSAAPQRGPRVTDALVSTHAHTHSLTHTHTHTHTHTQQTPVAGGVLALRPHQHSLLSTHTHTNPRTYINTHTHTHLSFLCHTIAYHVAPLPPCVCLFPSLYASLCMSLSLLSFIASFTLALFLQFRVEPAGVPAAGVRLVAPVARVPVADRSRLPRPLPAVRKVSRNLSPAKQELINAVGQTACSQRLCCLQLGEKTRRRMGFILMQTCVCVCECVCALLAVCNRGGGAD